MANINSTKSVSKGKSLTDAELKEQVKKLGAEFAKEKQVKVSIPTALAKNIGTELFIGINGVSLVLPVDGKSYPVPETFANHVQEYLLNLKS